MGHGGQQPSHPHGSGGAIGVGPGLLQRHRHKRPNHRQAAPPELGAQVGWVGGHKAPVAQLGASIAGVAQLIEHLRIADRLARQPFELERPQEQGAFARCIVVSITYLLVSHGLRAVILSGARRRAKDLCFENERSLYETLKLKTQHSKLKTPN